MTTTTEHTCTTKEAAELLRTDWDRDAAECVHGVYRGGIPCPICDCPACNGNTPRVMDAEAWTEFLSARFDGTEYEATHAEYYGWTAGVGENDDPEEVAAAWMEQADEE